MLGFGEEEGREIEKREEQQSMGLIFLCLCFFIFWFLLGFRKGFFFFLVLEKFFFIINTALMWKIVGVSEVSVLYIY